MAIRASNVRNPFRGKVKAIIEGAVVSEVDIETPAGIVTSVITTRSAHELGLASGVDVVALAKATDVSVAEPQAGPGAGSAAPHGGRVNDTPAGPASSAALPTARLPPGPPGAAPRDGATRVRTAQAADAAGACDLLRAAITRTCAPDHRHDAAILAGWLANKTPVRVATWIASAANHCVVAETEPDGALAGIALVTRKGRIALLHVDPDRLRRGIGSALLAGLERQARAWGLAELRVDATLAARDFFGRHGYRAGAQVRTTYGIDASVLVKRLVPSYAQRPACGCDAGGPS